MSSITTKRFETSASIAFAVFMTVVTIAFGVFLAAMSPVIACALLCRKYLGHIAKVSKRSLRDCDSVLFWMYERRPGYFNIPERLCLIGFEFEFTIR